MVQYATFFFLPQIKLYSSCNIPQLISMRGETELCAHSSCCHSRLYQLHVLSVMDRNCLLCHKKLILPVRFHACIRSKSIPTELMSPSVASCICPKIECIAVSVDLALFTVLSIHTKYINLLYITSFIILDKHFKEVLMYISVCCMNTCFYLVVLLHPFLTFWSKKYLTYDTLYATSLFNYTLYTAWLHNMVFPQSLQKIYP